MTSTLILLLTGVVALAVGRYLVVRLRLSRAKHPSLTGHVRMARRVARLVPAYAFDEPQFFTADRAPAEIDQARRAGFQRLARHFDTSRPRSRAALARLSDQVADAAFIARYRVPFPFSPMVRKHLQTGVLVERSHGVWLTDIDGHDWLDVGGAYGVNVFGYDFYKDCLAEAARVAGDLGPVLGPYHPVINETVERLSAVSRHPCVSFHMSGTEAVMQAVRLARYHTGRSHVVRFSGAYHGWWDEVQPGIGNPGRVGAVYTLAEMSEATLKVLATRRDIACVLVNPLQALHPNASAPGDGALVSTRSAGFDRTAYQHWIERLREVCTQRGIVLIFDEVFLGFRVARGGVQEWLGVQADLVTYGKTLGGGLPVGVVCGSQRLMQRYRDDRPLDICFARGTFNAHPWVIAAMRAFLTRLDAPEQLDRYARLESVWFERAERMNLALEQAELPLRIEHLSSVFSIGYLRPSRYNWMYQYYLNAEGLMLPWIGTGRLIFSLNYSDQEFQTVIERMVKAGEKMRLDGWWWHPEGATRSSVGRQILKETLRARFQRHSTSLPSPLTIGS